MKLQIEINLTGKEFENDPQGEAARVLRRYADVIERGGFGMTVGANWTPFDLRGEIAGSLRVVGTD